MIYFVLDLLHYIARFHKIVRVLGCFFIKWFVDRSSTGWIWDLDEYRFCFQEKEEAEEANKKYHQQLQDYKVPDVMEYVQEKADLYNLHKVCDTSGKTAEIYIFWKRWYSSS